MKNWALENRELLKRNNNYTILADSELADGQHQYFINLRPSKLKQLRNRTNGEFNIVVIGDRKFERDYFVIPYNLVKELLTEENLTHDKRWLIQIVRDTFTIFPGSGKKGISGPCVSNCYSINHPNEFV